ncbi:DUF835 domain-containing protein [Thermococcus gammatolerans]|uniref:DUF835 domain-containing protein n=1 Tax=Thermococcus gammatolerans (strain DSM 15229 / JCM 11827 / EJ3) TaxID=593117 RepID=C5A3G2_THEGJ|nr:DUF835 domain-containing protein [Thermococcus gammatolerans]ACS32774.1 Conserved hypothetical protein [Thermococcus gammatolerans EJ3]
MELIVPLYEVVYDVVLLFAMAYIWFFFFRRWNRYTAELKPFIRNAAVFLGFAVVGRFVDLVGDFYRIPYLNAFLSFFYGTAIVGVIYTMIRYVLLLEESYLHFRLSSYSSHTKAAAELKGAYIALGSKSKFVDVMELIKSAKLPTLVFTRNPHLYQGMEFVVPVWVTQATDQGISPTKLHVIQEHALKFIRKNPNAIVLIDCLEYLLLYNDFAAVYKFLINLKDYLIPAGAALIVIVDESALDERQRALLLREFEPL